MFEFLKAPRETLCRAAVRVKLLGVFDTVNSVAEFEVDNEFDNSVTTRHALSIDERRVKSQPVLLISPASQKSDPSPPVSPPSTMRDQPL